MFDNDKYIVVSALLLLGLAIISVNTITDIQGNLLSGIIGGMLGLVIGKTNG